MLHNKHLLVFLNRKVCENIWQYDFTFLLSLSRDVYFLLLPFSSLFFVCPSIYMWTTREIDENWDCKKQKKNTRRVAQTNWNRTKKKIFRMLLGFEFKISGYANTTSFLLLLPLLSTCTFLKSHEFRRTGQTKTRMKKTCLKYGHNKYKYIHNTSTTTTTTTFNAIKTMKQVLQYQR